ncbi:glycosyltransferase family 2 protein [Albidovulum sediminicola]|uniref:Glycosyltransferase family 2 protein n=1 Tax=Albidovulum sediminicola TaxID=2984331 RepID=A0ABT2Z1G9_9RHOB|nr:glycosyltransferase family 2 protein [Defluviimonas sp. WL0075]MCV2864988.1 glycosyltransferase family 2 protein [Defluviimonas sp. WL0075]
MLDLTAILTARNAAGTLGALLDHLEGLGARTVVIDHGSDDATWSIAAARRGRPVTELLYEPFTGVFDLTRQLRLKHDILQSIRTRWILHADADEFLEPPSGTSFAALLDRHATSGAMAFDSAEFMFLPATEDDDHDPGSFTRTMHRYVPFEEKYSKQRLFRRDAPLDFWFRTGGHCVTADPALVAPERLTLRHYLGLSLDDIRAQYLGRVFSARDRAKHWHGNRMASQRYDIVPPDPAILRDLRSRGLCPSDPVGEIPVFARRPEGPAAAPDASGPLPDLTVAGVDAEAVGLIAETLRAIEPTLRISVHGADPADVRWLGRTPLLHVLRDPRGLPAPGGGAEALRARASDWLRGVAQIRQAAVMWAPPYAEWRIEDGSDPARLLAVSEALRTGRTPPLALGLPRHSAIATAPADSADLPLRRIAGSMMRQLGYL